MNIAAAGRLFVISAPTGGGKTSLTKYVVDHLHLSCNLQKVITYTTRPMRAGEHNGVDYNFISEESFLEKQYAGFFLETTTYDIYHYGSPKYVLDQVSAGTSLILITDRPGAKEVKALYPQAILIWIGVPSMQAVEDRLTNRGREVSADLQRRIAMAAVELREEEREQIFDYHFTNDNFEQTAQLLTQFIKRSLESS